VMIRRQEAFSITIAIFAAALVTSSTWAKSKHDSPRADFSGYMHSGGNVKPPKVIDEPDNLSGKPESTEKSPTPNNKKKHIKGTVVLLIGVGTTGTVELAEVSRSAGADLDQKAMDAVRKWRFSPGTKKGVPVPTQINVEISFDLTDDSPSR
jgi:TonB family protein